MNSSLESCYYLWKSMNEFRVEVISIPASIFLMISRVYIVNEQEVQKSVQVCSLQHLHIYTSLKSLRVHQWRVVDQGVAFMTKFSIC